MSRMTLYAGSAFNIVVSWVLFNIGDDTLATAVAPPLLAVGLGLMWQGTAIK